jgi:hypothetical protein
MDNYFLNCPPKMGGFREITNYKTNILYNEFIKYKMGLLRDDDYRIFLQRNGNNLIDANNIYLYDNYYCWNNKCAFNQKRTLVHPVVFDQEMERNNDYSKRFDCFDQYY